MYIDKWLQISEKKIHKLKRNEHILRTIQRNVAKP